MQSVDYILISLVEDLDLQTKFETFRLKTSKQHVLLYGRGFVKAYSYLYFSEITYVIYNELAAFNTAYTYIYIYSNRVNKTQQQYMALGLKLVNRKTFFDEKTSIVCVDLQVPSNNTDIYIHMCVLFNFQMKKLLAMSQKEPLKVKVR